jgi:nucleoside-diphosphate-sugar epimerase
VLGAGPLGLATADALVADGRRVRVVNRSGKVADAPAGVELAAADLYSPAAVAMVTAGAEVVYQCAQPGYTEWPTKFPALQAAIIDGVATNRARLVIAENLYMYGDTDGAPVREGLPHRATGAKGRTRAAMAEAAFAAHAAGKLQVTAGRGSDFYGPRVLGSFFGERTIAPAVAGKPAEMYGNIDLPHTVTYIADFGRALAVLGTHDQSYGRAWHVPNDRPTITPREFMTLVAQAAGQTLRPNVLKRWQMQLAGLFVPAAREMLEMLYEVEKPYVVEAGTFERTFGLRPTPIDGAVRETVAWFQQHLAQTERAPARSNP